MKKDKPHPTDPYVKPMGDGFVKATSGFREGLDAGKLAQGMSGHSDPGSAMDLSPLRAALSVTLNPLVGRLMTLGAKGESGALFNFGLPNLEAANAAQAYTSWLVRGITDESRRALQTVMYRAFTEGLAPRDSGKQIADALRGTPLSAAEAARYGIIVTGLNERLANAVFSLAQSLTKQGYSAEHVLSKAQKYSERLLQYRGNLIARTETIRASSMGQQALWDAAVSNGYLDTATTTKMWSAASSSRTCGDCLDMDGEEVGIDEDFDTPWGSMPYPPGHGDCRCSPVLRFGEVQQPRESALDRFVDSVASQLTVASESMDELD